MYLDSVTSMDELKKEYRKLAFKYHPDRGGDGEIMKKINAEYEKMFAKLKRGDGADTQGTDADIKDDGFRSVIDKIIQFDGIEIEICGTWIWVSGNTEPKKEALKKAGFSWAYRKKMWYWHPKEARVRYYTGMTDIEYIRNMYGSQKIKAEEKQAGRTQRIKA